MFDATPHTEAAAEAPSAATSGESTARRVAPYLFVLVLMLAAAGFYDSYATSFRYRMTTFVREDFGVKMDVMVSLFSWIYLGSCLSFLFSVTADIVGRKPILLTTMVGLCVCQWAVGFARTPVEYTALLTVLAIFYRSDMWLVVMSEEAPPRHRGFFAALVVAISGSGAVVLGELVKRMEATHADPGAWRTVAQFPIYGLVLAVPILFFMRETEHFRALRARRTRAIDWTLLWAPFRSGLLKPLIFVSILKSILAGGVMATIALIETEYLRVDNGFSQGIIGWLIQGDVVATTLGWIAAGALSDWIGRRTGFYLMALGYSASLLLFALLPKGSVGVMWISVVHNLAVTGAFSILRVTTMELFPNFCRATAAAWTDLFMTLFASLNAWCVGKAMKVYDVSLASIIVAGALVVPITVVLFAFLPETRARKLDEI